MVQHFVVDTSALISCFPLIFKRKAQISNTAIRIIERALQNDLSIRLSIPSIVFVEIYEKWFTDEEISAKIRGEIYGYIIDRDNIEIKSIEKEVLEKFITLHDGKVKIDNHDKIILASAMTLNCPLITSDTKLIKYVRNHRVIPGVIT
jgi:predicted nucleic acid-binding protein